MADVKLCDEAKPKINQDDQSNERERLVKGLADDYASFLILSDPKEKQHLNETVEEVLMKLDDFIGLADMIRIDDNLTLNSTLTKIHAKSKDIEKHFDRIDRLEAYVAMVKQNLSEVEAAVNKAESDLSWSSLKMAISSIPFLSSKSPASPKSPSSPQIFPSYNPIRIFSTKDFFKSATKESDLVVEESEQAVGNKLELAVGESELAAFDEITLSAADLDKSAQQTSVERIENLEDTLCFSLTPPFSSSVHSS